jgi:hypothetical protein
MTKRVLQLAAVIVPILSGSAQVQQAGVQRTSML